MLHKVLGCCSCVILAAMLSQTQGRPSQDSLVLRSASSFAQDPSRTLPAHGRNGLEDQVFEFYGGARGKFLVISPSGKMSIRGHAHPPGQGRPDEEDVGVASEENDSVTVDQPPAEASVAEAKPIAVSVAGVGGTASAQPIATAIVGPGGLALTRPVATAIAGIKGVEGIASAIGGRDSRYQAASGDQAAQQALAGPIYFVLPGF